MTAASINSQLIDFLIDYINKINGVDIKAERRIT